MGKKIASHPNGLIIYVIFLKASPWREAKAHFSRWKLPVWIWIKNGVHCNGKIHSIQLLKSGVQACTGTMNPLHTTRTPTLDYGCVSKAILNHRYSQDPSRQNCGRSHASLVSLHVSSGNVLIALSSNTDFQYICKMQQRTLRGRSDSFLSITEGYSAHFSIMALPLLKPPCALHCFSPTGWTGCWVPTHRWCGRMQLTPTPGHKAQLSSGLHTRNSEPGQAAGGWVLTLCHDEQNWRPSILNSNTSSLLHLHLKSAPYTGSQIAATK